MVRFSLKHVARNAVAYLALLIAVGSSTAYAAGSIGSGDVIDNSLTSADIQNATAVRGTGIQDEDIASFSIMGRHLNGGIVTNPIIAENAVHNENIAFGAVGSAEIKNHSVGLPDVGISSVNSSRIVDGSIKSVDLAEGAVGSKHILNNSVTAEDLKNVAIGTQQVTNGSLTAQDFAPGTFPRPVTVMVQSRSKVSPADEDVREASAKAMCPPGMNAIDGGGPEPIGGHGSSRYTSNGPIYGTSIPDLPPSGSSKPRRFPGWTGWESVESPTNFYIVVWAVCI